jgi:hypothetical protein
VVKLGLTEDRQRVKSSRELPFVIDFSDFWKRNALSLVPDSFSSELVNIVLSSMKLASSYIMTSL